MRDLVKRLRNPPFGTESSERNLMIAAADHIERLHDALHDAQNFPWPQWASSILNTLKEFGWRFDDMIDLPEELANYMREYPDSAVEGLIEQRDDAQAEIARLTASNAAWQRNSRNTFDALCAMRNSINEILPMPSLESDLLQGPENSVFCAAVATAVTEHVGCLTAERDAIAAAAFEEAAQDCEDWADLECAPSLELIRNSIRALSPADAKAALDRMLRDAKAEGMRESAAVCMMEDVGETYEDCRDAILARAKDMEAGNVD